TMEDSMGYMIGDTVQLKSGGPAMTVNNVDLDNYVYCDWFDEHGDRHSDKFKADLLVAATAEAAPNEPTPVASPSL
ncbi:DUF2158 domain-containing protein, partial [Asticcacaulis sp.]